MKELFGQRLREQRLKHHLTLEQVAEKADLSANYIGMVERGLKEPGLATIVKILNALNTFSRRTFVRSGSKCISCDR